MKVMGKKIHEICKALSLSRPTVYYHLDKTPSFIKHIESFLRRKKITYITAKDFPAFLVDKEGKFICVFSGKAINIDKDKFMLFIDPKHGPKICMIQYKGLAVMGIDTFISMAEQVKVRIASK